MSHETLAAPATPTAVVHSRSHSATDGSMCVARLNDLQQDTAKLVEVRGQTVAVYLHEGHVYAVDNRCPHMGFPLHKGSVKDGILTCHWHHARFDLSCGGTFDIWADDVRGYPIEIRGEGDNAEIWLDPDPPVRDAIAYYRQRLNDGFRYNLRLLIAKAILGLESANADPVEALKVAAKFGTHYSMSGWGAGLTILTAMANILPALRPEDRPLALYHGLMQVSAECAGRAPRFPLEPLQTKETNPVTLKRWFLEFVERRDADGAQRCLRSAIDVGLTQVEIADMLFTACTDHFYRDIGHPMDFTNKAFELLDKIGWEYAGDTLTSLLPRLVNSARMEESSSWRHPIDLVDLLRNTFPTLPGVLETGKTSLGTWNDGAGLAESLLQDDPAASVAALTAALRSGATPEQLAATVVYAAARRIAHFHTRNEFGDWDTVLHTFTYANAVHQGMRRAPSVALLRAVYDAAMSVYLDRFLNTPPAPLPRPGATPVTLPDDLLELLNRQGRVNEAGTLVSSALQESSTVDQLQAAIGAALLREDTDFHTFQSVEAAFRQYDSLRGTETGIHMLVACARYLAAHAPTPRAIGQTYLIAQRLHRGEALYEG